jgi:hypothetical protein
MTIQSSGPLKLSDIAAEWGEREGPVPPGSRMRIVLSDYYAGNPGSEISVPVGTLGYPNGVATPIPSLGSPLRVSNFYGSSKFVYQQWGNNSLALIRGGNTDSDNLYFGGQVPETWAWNEYQSDTFVDITAPATGTFSGSGLRLVLSSWSVQLACGYTWWAPTYGSTRYNYDYAQQPGVNVYNITAGGNVGRYISDDATVTNVNNSWRNYLVPGYTINVTPGHTYRLRYTILWYRSSQSRYGDVSFGFFANFSPQFYIENYQ